jgi:hypothetical protein
VSEQSNCSALDDLAAYLSQRREAILRAWHAALDADPEFASFSGLSRGQFNDHIPAVLEAFEARLRRGEELSCAPTRQPETSSAAEHGLHRWQQGYDQRQTMREWTHLQICVLRELERFEASRPGWEPRVIAVAQRALARHCGDGVSESAERYQRLQQAEAASRLLPVSGDQAKVLRIAQNLLLNAFKATTHGGVRVTWEARDEQWVLSVQDTGPGFTRGPAAPLERALKLATQEAREVEVEAGTADSPAVAPAPTLPSQSEHRSPQSLSGEGIGLSIVKRLCELLDASLELDTAPGAGTTFRVTFPRCYADPVES